MRHRAGRPRPRYGRIAVLGCSAAVTAIAMLGGVGVLPSVAHDGPDSGVVGVVKDESPVAPLVSTDGAHAVTDSDADPGAPSQTPGASQGAQPPPTDVPAPDPTLPADSGEGRRVVFSEDQQRVWLIADDGTVERTYLVSGSVYDNLDPGTYSVYSRSEHATGVDGSGTMQWFVRFTEGDNGGAIGFHDIPVDDDEPVQSLAELGTPRSHGCIRQKTEDALALWEFAPLGTEVVVV